ncbi:MAG TPA: hypothetical protein VE130_13720, partial [Nitrososphaeraceae archaeon]|nr:hypothetical protein [Nitrososphaeraceae archaeon]
ATTMTVVVESIVLSFMIPKKLCPVIKEVAKEYGIDKVYKDNTHDNRKSFDLLDDLKIEPAISIRKMHL